MQVLLLAIVIFRFAVVGLITVVFTEVFMLKLKVVFFTDSIRNTIELMVIFKVTNKNTKHVNEFTLMFFLCCFSFFIVNFE